MDNKVVKNTKVGLKLVLERMANTSDQFIDALVKEYPSRFEVLTGSPGEMIHPFLLIQALNTYYEMEYESFRKKPGSIPENKSMDSDKIVDFSAAKKDKKETTH